MKNKKKEQNPKRVELYVDSACSVALYVRRVVALYVEIGCGVRSVSFHSRCIVPPSRFAMRVVAIRSVSFHSRCIVPPLRDDVYLRVCT
jgi:hypothetical protein